MARYVSLIRFTDNGARAIDKSASRAAAFKQKVEKAGVTVETQLWTMGTYDGVLVLNGEPNAIMRALAELAAAGNVRTETLQAFNAKELQTMAT